MSNWSSDKKMKLLFENFRGFVNELKMDRLLDSKYEVFVKYLGKNINDPKVLAMIDAGLDREGAPGDGDPNDDKFGFQDGSFAVSKLIPMQMEVDIDKSLAFPIKKKPSQFIDLTSGPGPHTLGGPIVVFNGQYIVDGHHRWSQLYACNKDASIAGTNMTIQGIEPLDALKAVQASIGTEIGSIPVQSVEGSNLFKMGENEIKGWLRKNVDKAFVNTVFQAGPEYLNMLKEKAGGSAVGLNEQISEERLAQMLINQILPRIIWSNVSSMQKTSQPVPGAPKRDFMPQTDQAKNWKAPLEAGEIDIVPPHGPGTDAEKKVAAESKTYDRWKKIIKG